MAPDSDPGPGLPVAANDNDDPGQPDPALVRKVDDLVMQLARLLGRQLARDTFARRGIPNADNDNAPGNPDGIN